jgi:hypothetical protein
MDADPLHRTPNDYTDPADRSIAEEYTKNVSFKKRKIEASNKVHSALTEHGRDTVPAAKIGREEATPAIKTEPAPTPSLFGNSDGIIDFTGDGDEAPLDPHEGMMDQNPFIVLKLTRP